MSWAIGYDAKWNRDIGYGVPAECDHPTCRVKIDRGLSFVCGGEPFGGNHGCGLYFCPDHLFHAGEKRDGVQLCLRCYYNRHRLYTPKPDVAEWREHKLTDESWAKWRVDNPDEVAKVESDREKAS
jgi:hypothetical protein